MCQYFIPFCGQIIFCCIDILYFIYSSIDGHSSCFYLSTIMNNAVINICVWVSVLTRFQFFWYIYLRVELLGHMVNSMFNHLRDYHTVSQSSWTTLLSHQYWEFILAILVGIKWYFIVVLIFISLITNDDNDFSLMFHLYISRIFTKKNWGTERLNKLSASTKVLRKKLRF